MSSAVAIARQYGLPRARRVSRLGLPGSCREPRDRRRLIIKAGMRATPALVGEGLTRSLWMPGNGPEPALQLRQLNRLLLLVLALLVRVRNIARLVGLEK